jgi:hypothetical protein
MHDGQTACTCADSRSPSSAADGAPVAASSPHAAGAAAPAGGSGLLSLSVAACVVCATDVRRTATQRDGFSVGSVPEAVGWHCTLHCEGPSPHAHMCLLCCSCAAAVHASLPADARQVSWCFLRMSPDIRCPCKPRATAGNTDEFELARPLVPLPSLIPLACGPCAVILQWQRLQ